MKYTVDNPGPTYFTVCSLGQDDYGVCRFYNHEDAASHADERFAGASYQIDEWKRSNGSHVRTEAHLRAERA